MTPSPDLFNLIKSLKQTEKRYFRLHAQKVSTDKNPDYLQLFNAIDDLVIYDEKRLKEKFKGKTFIKQLHVAKNYLTGAILQALAAYHDNNSVNNELLLTLQTIEILYQKELHDLCLKQIEKGIKLCKAYLKQDYLFLYLGWKARILQKRLQYHEVLNIVAEQSEITQSLGAYLTAKDSALRMHYQIVTKGFPRTQQEIEAMKTNNAILLNPKPQGPMSMEETYYHFITLGKFYAGTDDIKKRLEALAQLTGILEKNKKYTTENPDIYISALADYWIALVNCGKIKEAQSAFLKIRELAVELDDKKYDARIYGLMVSYVFEFDTAICSNQVQKAIHAAPRVRDLVKQAEGSQQKSTTLELIHQTFRLFFIAGRYNESLDWINMILNEPVANVREDLTAAAHIYYVLIHYELGNTVLLRNVITSTKNLLKYKRRFFSAEQTLLEHLQKLVRVKNENGKTEILAQLAQAFGVIYHDPNERKSTLHQDVFAWTISKATARPMGEIIAEHYREDILTRSSRNG